MEELIGDRHNHSMGTGFHITCPECCKMKIEALESARLAVQAKYDAVKSMQETHIKIIEALKKEKKRLSAYMVSARQCNVCGNAVNWPDSIDPPEDEKEEVTPP